MPENLPTRQAEHPWEKETVEAFLSLLTERKLAATHTDLEPTDIINVFLSISASMAGEILAMFPIETRPALAAQITQGMMQKADKFGGSIGHIVAQLQ